MSKSYEKVVVTIIKNEDDLKSLVKRKPDLIFSSIKYFNFSNQEIWLSSYLEKNKIHYITSNKEALNNEYDKNNAKLLVKEANINTANFFTTQPDEHEMESSLPVTFPLFLKPVSGEDSQGITPESVVFDFKKYQAKVLDIYNTQQSRTLVENYLSGKEYSVSILENKSKNILMILPIEIVAAKNRNGHRVLDCENKQNVLEELNIVSDKKIYKELCNIAINSFRALGGKTMGKIDIKTSFNGILHFVEANFIPELNEGYFYKSFLLNENMDYEQMILRIVDAGIILPEEVES
ncbi:MAG: ATP-grasp domain-containing protein [Arcobacteraceae bacterium]